MKNNWILLSEVNDYNQYGKYFIAFYVEKPTKEQIINTINCSEEKANHIINGGGRINTENVWYTLYNCHEGINYDI